MSAEYDNVYALIAFFHSTMATLIGSSGAGDDLIRKLHDMGVSRSCTSIQQVMERRDAIGRVIDLERERQERLLEKEMRTLKSSMKKYVMLDSLLFFHKDKMSHEYLRRIDHLKLNRDAIIENNLLYLYREKDILDRLTREYRSELKGYYGELLVMDTLEALSDDYYVISDVRITREFGHKFDGKMLKSARVDHVVVGRKGVYCIETKNWNLKWKSDDRPTPGEQARRASYLLYRYFPAYLTARQDVLSDEEVNQVVDCLKDRDVRFDDTLQETTLDKIEETESLTYEESLSGGELT